MRKVKLIKHLQEMLRSEADKIYRLNCKIEELEWELAVEKEAVEEMHKKLTQAEIDLEHAEKVRNVSLKFGNSMAEQYAGLCKAISRDGGLCSICGRSDCDGAVCDFRPCKFEFY